MANPYKTLTVSFDATELDLLDAAAESVGLRTEDYVRNAAMTAAKSRQPRSYTPQQLRRIHRHGPKRGKVWTEAELRARGLPLYWSKEWLEAQLDQGATYASLATRLGYRYDSISGHALRVHGIRRYRKLTPHDEQAVQAVLDGGGTVSAAAQTSAPRLGPVSRQRIANITWPATIRQIADQCFHGNYPAAAAWLHHLVRIGKLTKVKAGLYSASASDHDPSLDAPARASYEGVDWSLTNRAIASQLGVTEQAVWKARRRLGAPPSPHARKVSRADIRKLLDEGLTPHEIGQRLGVAMERLWYHLSCMRKDGEPMPPSAQQHLGPAVGRRVTQQLLDLAREGREWPTIKELMAATGAGRSTADRWLRTAKARLAEERA